MSACCIAAAYRAAADRLWDADPQTADALEAAAVRLLAASGLPLARAHVCPAPARLALASPVDASRR